MNAKNTTLNINGVPLVQRTGTMPGGTERDNIISTRRDADSKLILLSPRKKGETFRNSSTVSYHGEEAKIGNTRMQEAKLCNDTTVATFFFSIVLAF